MAVNRVQKLLFSEYCDFEDMVLIESPFAQTTKDGTGIRQVHIGLTESKLVLATDVLPPVDLSKVTYIPGLDPEIETFELIAIYPVECVNLSIYRRRRRQALKARFCNNRVLYFELGGFEKRKMFWNLWCEKVRFLTPEDGGSSHSETSVATSSTGSTLYLLDKKIVYNNGLKQLWCRFGPNYDSNNGKATSGVKKWTDKQLFLGSSHSEYRPIVHPPTFQEFVKPKRPKIKKPKNLPLTKKENEKLMTDRDINYGDTLHINRFGQNIYEGCGTGLYLPVENYKVPDYLSGVYFEDSSEEIRKSYHLLYNDQRVTVEELAEAAVRLWELYREADPQKINLRHRRRYGILPQPHFLYGLGPWTTIKGDEFSVQVKRAPSMITIRRQPVEPELRLPISKRQLVASVSCEMLNSEKTCCSNNITNVTKSPITFFWTPNYWYRPRSAKDAYLQLQTHLSNIRNYHKVNNTKSGRRKSRRKFLNRLQLNKKEEKDTDEEDALLMQSKKLRKKRSKFVYSNLFNSRAEELSDVDNLKEPRRLPKETSLQYMKRLLELDVNVTAWDFNSKTLAEQLTMIDRDLFLKINTTECEILAIKRNSKFAPNILALIAFSHRISCLVTTEILRDESDKIRARLMARFINVADKCHKMSNFQSCKTVLSGLQSPAVYRLSKTWAYVRKRHSSKYIIYEYLCRLYKDPRSPRYQKSFFIAMQNSQFLPCIGDVFAKLLDRIPEYKIQKAAVKSQTSLSSFQSAGTKSLPDIATSPHNNLFSKLFKVFNTNYNCVEQEAKLATNNNNIPKDCKRIRTTGKYKHLCDYFKPLHEHEDNREECLKHTIEFLEKCQLGAIKYAFHVNELARNYLLKSRYSEDRENFYNSQSKEAPLHNLNYTK